MITITRHGTILLYDFQHPSEQVYVNNLLAIKNPSAFMIKRRNKHMASWDGMIRHLKKVGNKHWSYAGFLGKLTSELKKEGVEVDYRDDYELKPIEFEQLLKPDSKGVKITLDEPQVEACCALLSHRLCCLELETGGGKSELACNAIMCYLRDNPRGKVLFLVPRLNLLYQTRDRLAERSGLPVGMVGDGKFEIGCRITVATSSTACARDHLTHAVEIKEWLKTIDVLILDEAHRSKGAPYCEVIQKTINAKHVWAISAKMTYTEAKDKQFELEGMFGPPVFQGVNPDRTVPVIIKYHKHQGWKGLFDDQELSGNIQDEVKALFRDPETKQWGYCVWRGPDSEGMVPKWMLKLNEKTGKYRPDKTMYGLYIPGTRDKIPEVESDAVVYMTRHDVGIMTFDERNKWAAKVALQAYRAKETFVITVRRRRHAVRILRELKLIGIIDAIHIGGFMTGKQQTEAAEMLRTGSVPGAVAVITTVTEGLDIPGLVHVIRCEGQVEEQLNTQVCGRVQRRSLNKKCGYVHIPADEQHKDLRKNASAIISYYKKQGRKIEDVIWQ